MGRGAWWAAVHGVAKSRTRLGDFPFTLDPHAPWKDQHHLVKKTSICVFLPALGLIAAGGLSRVVAGGLLTAVASPVAGRRLQCLGRGALAALWHVESSQTMDRTPVPGIGRRVLNRWTTREVSPLHPCP